MSKSDRARSPGVLPDEEARRAIREDLRATILVEAAAGTGKTTSLVDRMVALVATGTTTVGRLSAVTFTIKAAAQLRQRFQNALEKALRDERDEGRRSRLGEALAGIDSCFLGTIHAFGARLLRERPVEAGVDPGFREMDEPEDGVARSEAWERFTAGLFLGDDPRLARLMALGVSVNDLSKAYESLCENSDVEPAAGPESGEPDFAAARREIAGFLERAAAQVPGQPPPGGWTGFQEAVRSARRLSGLLDLDRGPDFVRILRVLRRGPATDGAGPLEPAMRDLRDRIVKPALARWAEHVHPAVIRVLADARDQYRSWRRSQGRLNFQDLLVYARDLLRDHSPARRALRERFTPILVDEFQDTDPVQAEILFYLTGEDTGEKDWKKLTPVAGSLFVVGDPKQSIYRFRRADIETYENVRDRIAASGRVLQLTTNFRSTAALCDWVNKTFASLFPAAPTREQAGYVPLSPERPAAAGPAVFRLPSAGHGNAARPVVESDSRRIADFIAAAIAGGGRRPGDFLVLFRRRAYMTEYARALEQRRVPHEIAGGAAFRGSEEIEALLLPLRALADPDDPVPLVAALRGRLFGVDDQALYRFVREGGQFRFGSAPPEQADGRIRRAYALLREGADLVEGLPPAAAISRFADRLGVTALAAAEELGDSRAGNLLKGLAAARKLSAEGLAFPAIVREIERMREEELIEQMSVDPGRPSAVRLMTLHGAKGLEAPVVFLAEPAGDPSWPCAYWIDRTVEPPAGHFRVVKRTGEFGEDEIARPPDWDEKAQIEKRFEEAEKARLLYVAATRAKEMLVVSVKRTAAGKGAGPWARLDRHLPADLPQPPSGSASAAAAPPENLPAELAAFRSRRAQRRRRCGVPSHAVVSVTDLAHAQAAAPARERTGRGMQWGRIIHGLLEASMRDPGLDLPAYAANLFAEEERPPEDIEEAIRLAESVRASALWRRALAATRRLVEVPFSLLVPSRDLGLAGGPPETLLQGAIDLVFEEEGGWTLVDYKSDTVAGDLAPLVSYYAPQVGHYRRYWRQLTGRPTRAGLFFVPTGQEVWLPDDPV